MEDFLDQVFLTGPRSEVSRSSYIGSAAGEADGLLVDALRNVHEENDKNLQANASPLTWESNVNASMVEENMYHWVAKGPLHERIQLDRIAETGFNVESLNTSSSAGYVRLPSNLSGAYESNGNGPSAFEPSLKEYPVFSANWPSQYGAGPLPAPIIGQERTNGYGLQGGVVGSDESITHDKLGYLGNLSTTLDQDDLQKTHLLNFNDRHLGLSGAAGGICAQQKVLLSEETNSAAHYGNQITVSGFQSPTSATVGGQMASKTRVRARRGQATDPHSIAERLRREKIAGRLKNLQELVPNSNKTDKASSLDEIIEYVKFLQHQVKILSMSRVGAAGAVLPLITDNQSEGSRSLLQAAGGHVPDSPHSPDDVAFEQEVVKLMESNITSAMQFLQSKGLCLMPIALAAAMSSGKLPSNSQNSDWKKPLPTIGANGSVTGLHANDRESHEESGQKILINGCNGAVKSEVQKSKLK